MKNKLTLKQKKFVQEYVATNGNGTKAALRVYDTNKPDVAKAIATENLTKPSVREELERILRKEEYRVENYISNTSDIASEQPLKGYSGTDVLRANELMMKLHGVLTDRKQIVRWNVNTDLEKLSKHELLELRERKKIETEAILAG